MVYIICLKVCFFKALIFVCVSCISPLFFFLPYNTADYFSVLSLS